MLIVAIIHDVFLKIQGEDAGIAYTGYDGEMLRRLTEAPTNIEDTNTAILAPVYPQLVLISFGKPVPEDLKCLPDSLLTH